MKLIVTGATGFVGREVIRQSLARPEITTVVALARRPVSVPERLAPGSDVSKLRSVVIEDYGVYPDDVRKELAGAGACIWTVAITPTTAKFHEFEYVRRVCQTYALAGLRAMHEAGAASPFRFIYMSGAAAERDQTKTPKSMPEYCLMRGETENQLLALARELGDVEVAAVKPGYITAPRDYARMAMGVLVKLIAGYSAIDVVDLSVAMLDQVVKGFEKDELMPEDLVRISQAIPKKA